MALPNGPYNFSETEAEMLKYWLENGFYKPEYDSAADKIKSTDEMKSDSREAWSLICPPPNAYGRPHIGNISGYAYQDAIARYNRMKGKKVLVLPGKDHAGLEGEGVFVREVLEKKGINKFDLKREDFYQMMMEYNHENMKQAQSDEKTIGLSADFDRDTFTLDPDIVDTVLDTFIEMYKKNMIYKGVRIVNWDPKARTAVADNQIEYKETVTPFVYFKYGFLEPEQKALELKSKFKNQNVKFRFERHHTKDGKGELPFAYGFMDELEIIGIGFDKMTPRDTELSGKVIGIQMRLDNKFRLVVISENFSGDLEAELHKIFIFEAKYYAGAHIIEFAKYVDDKFYNNGFILGTVRPETKFGDTALAVDSSDERYKDFVGKSFEVRTLIGTAKLNIIADYAVDKEFGTGMVKVTPAHSQTDWEIAQRHPAECLPPKQVIGYDLKLNHLCGKYAGLNIKQAREQIVNDMKEQGMLVAYDANYQNRIQIAERTKAPIEPLLSSQWYLKYDGIKEAAMQMVKEGRVVIHPGEMEAKFNHWMENLRDWAISRSLWWGYRLPVWYHGEIREEIGENGEVKEMIKLQSQKFEEESEKLDITIEKGKPEDADKILEIEVHGWQDNFVNESLGFTKDRLENEFGFRLGNEQFTRATINSMNEGSRAYFVAKEDNEVVGWACVENIKTEETKWIDIYIARDHRSKGIGKLLMEKIYAEFPDFELHIAVPEHSRAVGFYKKIGFTEYHRSTNNRYGLLMIQMWKPPVSQSGWTILEYNNPDHLRVQKESPGEDWHQDENVLDTWFSSGQWPYATLKKYDLMDTFYPTNVMVTMYDILENWVSRMMMFSAFKENSEPFKNVFLTGMVLGPDGQKMSKSKGNLIDIDDILRDYGSDALRLTYFYQNSAGGSYVVNHEKLKTFRQFNNKLWNATRFVLMNTEEIDSKALQFDFEALKLDLSKQIISHIKETKAKITKNIEDYEFGHATYNLYHEFWHTFCDIQIEAAKPYLYTQKDKVSGEIISEPEPKDKAEMQAVLMYTLKEYLKMLHPFIPFITERIWQEVPKVEGEHKTLMHTRW